MATTFVFVMVAFGMAAVRVRATNKKHRNNILALPKSSKSIQTKEEQQSNGNSSHTRASSLYRKDMLGLPRPARLKHALITNAVPMEELQQAFEQGVLKCYKETQLPTYSRYEKWTQSCYMEVDEKWTPRPEINLPLFESLTVIQERCRLVFAQWYADLYNLESVEVTTLNSFVTKYVPQEGKSEFGKHVDGIKVEGSLVLCLPTDEPNDWPGMLVWDGPKGRGPVGKDPRPEHHYCMQPGDALLLDRMVWHHGLPITKGHRFVIVNFYAVQWKKLANTAGL